MEVCELSRDEIDRAKLHSSRKLRGSMVSPRKLCTKKPSIRIEEETPGVPRECALPRNSNAKPLNLSQALKYTLETPELLLKVIVRGNMLGTTRKMK